MDTDSESNHHRSHRPC
ncbi:hypothetical protein NXW27_17280 [Phocaeicola dorei]|nr:hypothetical protein [Phocaeicola dorei]